MACASCAAASPATTATADRLDALLASFWPPGVPFPPMAPYVAAVVSRSDLRQWALDIGADQHAAVLSGDPTAILSLLGQAMTDPSLVYAAARKKRKGKGSGGGASSTCAGSSFSSMGDCVSWVRDACDGSGRCEPMTNGRFCGTCDSSQTGPSDPSDPTQPGSTL